MSEHDASWDDRSATGGTRLEAVLFRRLPDGANAHLHRWHVRAVLSALSGLGDRGPRGANPRPRLLDVGCGYGRMTRAILEHIPEANVAGVDLSERSVALYRRTTGCEAVVAPVEALPATLRGYDAIVCVTVLMYLGEEAVAGVLRDLAARLGPHGRLILIENDRSGLPFTTGFGLLAPRSGSVGTGGRVFAPGELRRAADAAGVRIVREARMPATTLLFLPLAALGFLPGFLFRPVSALVSLADRALGRLHLPSVYVMYEVVP